MLLRWNIALEEAMHLALSIGMFFCSVCVEAQDSTSVSVHGQASCSAEYYSLHTEPSPFFYPRRPANLYRLVATPTINLPWITIPCTFILSSQQTNFSTAVSADQTLTQFIQNPVNVIAVEPRWSWGTLHLGSFTPHWSELSAGDVQVFGLGCDLRPGSIRVSAFRGVSQRAVEPFSIVTQYNQLGAYERVITGVKLGFGREEKGYVDFQYVRTADDTTSITTAPPDTLIRPQEELLLSIATRIVLDSGVSFGAEAATNVYTRDMRAAINDDGDIPKIPGIQTRISSFVDYGLSTDLSIQKHAFGLILQAKMLGPGFMPMAYPNMLSDRIEATIQPRVLLWDNRIQCSGSFGYRINNVHNTLSTPLSQVLFSLNASVVISQNLSLSTSYSNFGVRNQATDTALHIQNVSQYFSMCPTYSFRSPTAFHSLSLSATFDSYTDYNVVSSQFTTNLTRSLFAAYSIALQTIPLNANASVTTLQNSLPFFALHMVGVNLGASYRLLQGSLIPGIRTSYTHNVIGSGQPDEQILVGVQCLYLLSTRVTFHTDINLTHHSFQNVVSSSYTEQYVQMGVSTRF